MGGPGGGERNLNVGIKSIDQKGTKNKNATMETTLGKSKWLDLKLTKYFTIFGCQKKVFYHFHLVCLLSFEHGHKRLEPP